jgi:CRISPR type IV-associated protein Csf1
MDDASLAGRESSDERIACGYCIPFLGKTILSNTQRCVFSATGTFPASKLIHKKWLLLHPPEGESVWVHNDTKMGHVVWKAPVTRSPDFILVQFGNRCLSIRRRVVLDALAICGKFQLSFPTEGKKKPPRSPFFNITDLGLSDLGSGSLRLDAHAHLSGAELAHLSGLSLGEMWALEILLATPEAEEPPLVSISEKLTKK